MLPSSLRPNNLLHNAPPYTFSVRQLPTPTKARTVFLLSSTACKLLSGKQLIRTERHGQKLLQRHDRVLAQLVVHQYGRVGLQYSQSYRLTGRNPKLFSYIAELADELSAHAARAGGRRNVGGNCYGAEVACFSSLVTVSINSLVGTIYVRDNV